MKPRVVLVHGFNVRDPRNSIERVRDLFENYGFHTTPFRYGWTDLLDVRFGSKNLAYALLSMLDFIDNEVIVIGHSNGCNLINQAAWLMEEALIDSPCTFRRAVYLSPALNRTTRLCPVLDRADVFHTKSDWAVRLASVLPFHRWGSMGAHGYGGSDIRYHNHDASLLVKGHSGWFEPAGLRYLTEHLIVPLAKEYPE